jgi:hypothetical protein
MTIRYSYKSSCCGHEYVEQRAASEEMLFPTCNACGKNDYVLINEEKLSDEVEREQGPE